MIILFCIIAESNNLEVRKINATSLLMKMGRRVHFMLNSFSWERSILEPVASYFSFFPVFKLIPFMKSLQLFGKLFWDFHVSHLSALEFLAWNCSLATRTRAFCSSGISWHLFQQFTVNISSLEGSAMVVTTWVIGLLTWASLTSLLWNDLSWSYRIRRCVNLDFKKVCCIPK